ncbi:hypothetical protein MKX01_018817, partial [Papaver californicum]
MAEADLSEVVIGDEPLTSSNYENWKVYMHNYLSNLNLWGIVSGTESEPDDVNTWMMKNEMALHAIKTSCALEMVPHLQGINSAKEAWDQLASMQSSEVNMPSSSEETGVVLEIQHDDDNDAVPETQVFTCQQSLKRSVFSKTKSDLGEQMTPQALSDEDRPDAVPEIKESLADAVTRMQQTLRDINSGWSDDKPVYIRFRPLYKALTKGDWETAKEIIEDHPEGLSAKITSRRETALHAAVLSGKLSIVKELLKLLPPEALESKNSSGDTAISLSISDGITEIAKLMVEKNDCVLRITNQIGLIPLVMSILYEKEDMFAYLRSVTPWEELDPDKSKNGASFLLGAINAEMFDVALEVLELYPRLAISKDMYGYTAISVLAHKSHMFLSGSRFGFWQRCMYSSCAAFNERQPSLSSSKYSFNLVSTGASFYERQRSQELGSGESVIVLKQFGAQNHSTTSRFGGWLQNIYSSCLCVVPGVKDLQKKKRKHVQVLKLLKAICSAIGRLTDEELKDVK